MELQALLEFVDKCDVSDADDQQLRHHDQEQKQVAASPPAVYPRRQSSGAMPKPRRRRDVLEIAALQKQVAGLALELREVQQGRVRANPHLVLTGPSHWRTESDRQSRLRTESQKENERLKAKVHAQKQVAKRLANVLKRSSANQMLQMLRHFERDAKLRAQKRDDDDFDECDNVYCETDAVLADTEMDTLPPVFFDTRMRQQSGQRGFMVEFRRRVNVECDRETTSEAYWRFIPHHSFSRRFIIDHRSSCLDGRLAHTLCFRSKNGPSQTRFRGRYLLRRYVTDERIVVAWKALIRPEDMSSSEVSSHFQLEGRGWAVFHSTTAHDEATSTSIQTIARFFPTSKLHAALALDHERQDTDMRVLIDFVTCAAEGYAAFAGLMTKSEQ